MTACIPPTDSLPSTSEALETAIHSKLDYSLHGHHDIVNGLYM